MSKEITTAPSAAVVEQVLIKGDLSGLTAPQRAEYYGKVCESVGLNPLTKPFEYITLNGKLVLYALRACTDQLRTIHDVSVMELTETEREGVFIVTAKVQNGKGRTDASKGAVSISGLKGEALANALMKAETKAKRRATLSICGLGFLDETEVETIPGAVVGEPKAPALTVTSPPAAPVAVQAAPPSPPPAPAQPQNEALEPSQGPTGDIRAAENAPAPSKDDMDYARTVFSQVEAAVKGAVTVQDIEDVVKANMDGLKHLYKVSRGNWSKLKDYADQRRKDLTPPEAAL